MEKGGASDWLFPLRLSGGNTFLHCFLQRIDAFGAALDGRLAGARIASRNGFFAAFAEAALESIPPPPDSNGAVADYDRIGSGWNYPIGGGRSRIEVGSTGASADWRFRTSLPPLGSSRSLLRDGISGSLLGRRSDVAVGSRAMHHRIGNPFRTVAPFMSGPLTFGVEIGFVVWGETFYLALIQVCFEIIVMPG
jgi:hypothetical protein